MTMQHPLYKPDLNNHFYLDHVNCLISSLMRWEPKMRLVEGNQQGLSFAKSIYEAPFILVSHNTDTDPVFNYANQVALELFEMNWEEFVQLPSRYSAETDHQKERFQAVSEVNRKGILYHYSGIRISKSGKRVLLEDGMIWNVLDLSGQPYGQAALFHQWRYL